MKFLLHFLPFLILVSSINIFAGTERIVTTTISGKERKYLIYAPSNLKQAKKYPLVLAFHGGGGDMKVMTENYNLKQVAEKYGFYLVFPNGASRFPRGKLATWNAGKCCAYAKESNSNDVAFVETIISEMTTQSMIDPKRVYATGMSNGAMFSYRLACEIPHKIAAVAAVAGTKAVHNCPSKRPTPILHIHDQNDKHVLFNGGCGPNCRTGVNYTSVQSNINFWAKHNKCQQKKKNIIGEKLYCETFSQCSQQKTVKLCVTNDGGHSWPGGVKFRLRQAPPSQAMNASEVIWKFISQFSLN